MKTINRYILALMLLHLPLSALPHSDTHHRLTHLNQHILLEPSNAELYLRRGRLHLEQSHFTLAQQDFVKALTLAPEQHGTRYFLAEALLYAGQTEQAAAQVQQFIHAHDQHVRGALSRGYWLLGQVRMAQQQHELAVKSYRSAFKVTDEMTPEHYQFFVQACRAADGNYLSEALTLLDMALVKGGSVELLQNQAIDIELQLGRIDAALQRLDSLITRQKSLPFLYRQRAEILLNADRVSAADSALTAANKALALIPEHKRRLKAYQTLAQQISTLQAQINNKRTIIVK